VLSLMMMTTSAAGGNTVTQENPRQAGKSSIYFYDVERTDTHGSGQLVIDMDKHTFVFIGKDFVPSSHIALRARAVDSTGYVVFASGKATPSGNLHIAGTWEADTPPAEIATSIGGLYAFLLQNDGGFIAKVACYYSTDGGVTWTESDHSDNILLDQEKWVELPDLGVPEYALVKIHVIVKAGKDRTGSEVFESWYYPGWTCTGYYHIKGTTWNPKLYYDNYSCSEF
jgi:hypothetical protein